jgi:periplasmic divalent cation tolerance protein
MMEISELDSMLDDEVKHVVILVTVTSPAEGSKIGRALVEEKLAACANMIEGLTSVFMWKGKVEEAKECQLIIKTRTQLLPDVIARVKDLHSYDVPEIIALPIIDGNPSYLQWIDEVT